MPQTFSRRAMLGSLAAIPALAQDSSNQEKQTKLWNGRLFDSLRDGDAVSEPFPGRFDPGFDAGQGVRHRGGART